MRKLLTSDNARAEILTAGGALEMAYTLTAPHPAAVRSAYDALFPSLTYIKHYGVRSDRSARNLLPSERAAKSFAVAYVGNTPLLQALTVLSWSVNSFWAQAYDAATHDAQSCRTRCRELMQSTAQDQHREEGRA